jgi:hypothetical protein
VANTKYSELLDDVLPNLAADPSDPVTEYAIKRAVIDFCAGSWIWKHLPDAIDVSAGESTYDLEPLPGTDITVVMDGECNGVPITNKGLDWLNREIPGWRSTRNTPKYFTQVDTEQVILAPVPDATISAGLTLTLALQPSQNSTGFPKWIANQYLYALADGAIARLMLMPNKPWTDLANGQDRRSKFEAAIANARANAVSALGRASQRTSSQH